MCECAFISNIVYGILYWIFFYFCPAKERKRGGVRNAFDELRVTGIGHWTHIAQRAMKGRPSRRENCTCELSTNRPTSQCFEWNIEMSYYHYPSQHNFIPHSSHLLLLHYQSHWLEIYFVLCKFVSLGWDWDGLSTPVLILMGFMQTALLFIQFDTLFGARKWER